MLTDLHSDMINSAIFTHEYSQETDEDFTAQFQADTGLDNGEDIGGIVVYLRDNELLAFFDYEQAAGAVFKMPW